MNFNDFPLELREIIYFFIVDKKSILNSRLVCREWYSYLKNVREYFGLGIVIEHKFEKNKFTTKNLFLNLPIKEIEFMNSICEEHPDNTLLMVSREITAKGIREKFRHIQANDAELEAFAVHGSTE